MKNILIKLIKNKNRCNHKHALLHSSEGYCPDCGKYLVKNYYIVRCSACDVKREAKLVWGEIVPQEKYCTNCGSKEYYIEKLDQVNFIDAQYAVYIKEIVNEIQNDSEETQVWVEDNGIIKQIPRLLT